jgi:hypothetical protein
VSDDEEGKVEEKWMKREKWLGEKKTEEEERIWKAVLVEMWQCLKGRSTEKEKK